MINKIPDCMANVKYRAEDSILYNLVHPRIEGLWVAKPLDVILNATSNLSGFNHTFHRIYTFGRGCNFLNLGCVKCTEDVVIVVIFDFVTILWRTGDKGTHLKLFFGETRIEAATKNIAGFSHTDSISYFETRGTYGFLT